MNSFLKYRWAIWVLVAGLSACASPPDLWHNPARPRARAPVVDRAARRPPVYPAQPSPTDIAPIPQDDDPLLPREYASGYSSVPDPYLDEEPTYSPNASNDVAPVPYPTPSTEPVYPSNSTSRYSSDGYQPPSYPPGAARLPDQRINTTAPGALPEPQVRVAPPVAPVRPPVAPPLPPEAPVPPTATASTPVAPAGSISTPPSVNSTVALAPPPDPDLDPNPAPVAPPPRPIQATPPSPENLPPAEISRDGNQAVVALLDSADKYVKSKQLDKAGAALERALRIEPRNASIWHDLAQIRLHQGRYEQAESLATKSNNLASDNRMLQSRNWKLISTSRRATGNIAGAEEAEAQVSQLSH